MVVQIKPVNICVSTMMDSESKLTVGGSSISGCPAGGVAEGDSFLEHSFSEKQTSHFLSQAFRADQPSVEAALAEYIEQRGDRQFDNPSAFFTTVMCTVTEEGGGVGPLQINQINEGCLCLPYIFGVQLRNKVVFYYISKVWTPLCPKIEAPLVKVALTSFVYAS